MAAYFGRTIMYLVEISNPMDYRVARYVRLSEEDESEGPSQSVTNQRSLLDGIDTVVESSANDITPFRAIINDMYAKDISKKIKSVKRDKQLKGQYIGGKPMYCYKMHPTEKNRIVIDEKMTPTVRRIFAMARSGISCRQIAATLNEEGVPTPAVYCGWNMGRKGPYAGLWSSERISEMLQNETYIGNMVQGRTVKISYKSKKCLRQARENWVIVEGTHEPLIDALRHFEKFRCWLIAASVPKAEPMTSCCVA